MKHTTCQSMIRLAHNSLSDRVVQFGLPWQACSMSWTLLRPSWPHAQHCQEMWSATCSRPAQARIVDSKNVCSLMKAYMQGLAQTVWSYGKLGQPAPRLMTLAVAAAAAASGDGLWNMRDIVDLLWGCARLGHMQPFEAFQTLSDQICAILNASGDIR